MENKTAMQELIEYFEKDTTKMRDFYVRFMSRRYDLLEKEKQQIEDAYWDGGQDIPLTEEKCEQYYNKYYK